jgi:hypothetical protein
MYTALSASSITLREFLSTELKAAMPSFFDSGGGGTMVVSLNTPHEMTENSASGLSLWLYRIMRDDQQLNVPRTRVTPEREERVPFPARLYYLVAPVIPSKEEGSPETEQTILGKVIQALHDTPILHGSDLQSDLKGADIQLHIRMEQLTLEEITRVWGALNKSYQLCVSYEVSVAMIHSARAPRVIGDVEAVEARHSLIVE